MCILHKWSKWTPYEEKGYKIIIGVLYPPEMRGKSFSYQELRQRRTCLKCGKMQDELVKGE